MLSCIISGSTVGMEACPIQVEVDIPNEGLPRFTVVGLPDKAVEESKERVRSAIKNSGADFPEGRITVNLAPADLPKQGPSYDLPIALGILIASGQINPKIEDSLFMGELSLDGKLRHTQGVLPVANMAREKGIARIFVPKVNETEASIIPNVATFGVTTLLELIRFLNNTTQLIQTPRTSLSSLLKRSKAVFDFSEIVGQEQVKRAMEIAAAGSHNIFMRGTPGSGKTMIARAMPGILPRLTEDEALEVTKLYSITGNLSPREQIITTRPFRSPHHTTSRIGLIGGGSNPTPGEISLSHRGVLFLDEFPEFPRSVLESLRQPLEDGLVTISRARGTVSYPARFLLVAASNPCPCGYYGDATRRCTCMPGNIIRYQKRISGPLLDRIDLHVSVASVDIDALMATAPQGKSSKQIQQSVQKARDHQSKRFASTTITSNSEMTTRLVKKYCTLDDDSQKILRSAITQLKLSARSYFKVIKVARTIADLEGNPSITTSHIAEALQFRLKDS